MPTIDLTKEQVYVNKQLVKSWFDQFYTRLLIKGYDQFRVANRVEDAIMDAFYRILKNNQDDDYSLIKKPFGFIWKTFYWSYLDLYRKGKRVQERLVPLDDIAYGIVCHDQNEYIEVKREIFNLLLPELPKNQQTSILLYLEGYTYEEIGQKLETTHDKVSYAIRTAKKYFRDNAASDQMFN